MAGLSYPTTQVNTIIGSKTAAGVRTSVALTNAYQAETGTNPTKSFKTDGFSKMNLDVLYTMGATETSNSVEVKVEQSPDGINFYQVVNDTTSGGTSTLTAREFTIVGVNASTLAFSLPLDISARFARVSFKETGVAANAGSVYADITLLGK
jgi:hypothetical protein